MVLAEYSLITYPDGGFISSTNDLGLYLSELMKGYDGKGTRLNKTCYQNLFEKQVLKTEDSEEESGIFIEYTNDFIRIPNALIGHNGSDPGVSTAMYFSSETETGKILFINTDSDFNDNYWPEVVAIWQSLIDFEDSLKKS